MKILEKVVAPHHKYQEVEPLTPAKKASAAKVQSRYPTTAKKPKDQGEDARRRSTTSESLRASITGGFVRPTLWAPIEFD